MNMSGDNATAEVFGLYELSSDGTVLYSRSRDGERLTDGNSGVIGRDFFREIAGFQNTDDLRRHFRRFVTEDRSVDTFVFDCLYETEVVRAKVFMTRAYENDHDHSGGIVILDIRRMGNQA